VSRYRNAWTTTTAVAMTVGVWASCMYWPLSGVLAAFLCSALAGSFLTAAALVERCTNPLPRVIAYGALTGLAVLGAAGVIVLLGPVAVLMVAVLAATSPLALRWIRSAFRILATGSTTTPRPQHGPPPDDAVPVAAVPAQRISDHWAADEVVSPADEEEPATLTDAELCRVWRASYVGLQHTHSPAARMRLVQRRQACLDEFERRNPAGFATWLASGARAASDPARFIVPKQHG
jgi:hypothetical protein